MRLKTIMSVLSSAVVLISMFTLATSCTAPKPLAAAAKTTTVKVKLIPDTRACDGFKIRLHPTVPRPRPNSDRLVWTTDAGPMTINFDDPVAVVNCTTTPDSSGNYTCTSGTFTNSTGGEFDEPYGISIQVATGGYHGEVREDPVIIVQPGP